MKELGVFEKQSIIISLKDMFKDNSFSICTIDNCLKITGIIPDAKDYNCLRAVHCIAWSEMPIGYRREVFQKVINMFQAVSFDLSEIEKICNPKIVNIEQEKKKRFFGLIK